MSEQTWQTLTERVAPIIAWTRLLVPQIKEILVGDRLENSRIHGMGHEDGLRYLPLCTLPDEECVAPLCVVQWEQFCEPIRFLHRDLGDKRIERVKLDEAADYLMGKAREAFAKAKGTHLVWRVEPEMEVQTDFATWDILTGCYARYGVYDG